MQARESDFSGRRGEVGAAAGPTGPDRCRL